LDSSRILYFFTIPVFSSPQFNTPKYKEKSPSVSPAFYRDLVGIILRGIFRLF